MGWRESARTWGEERTPRSKRKQVGMEAEVEGVDVWRCVSLPAELEGVGWTVELAACGISAPRDLIGEDALERAPRRWSET